MSGPVVTVIAPTYCERDNVGALAEGVAQALHGVDYRLLFVDDASPDGTAEVVEALMADDPRVGLRVRTADRGLSKAVLAGVDEATTPFVAVMDADLQHDPSMLPALLALVSSGEADIAVASRFVDGGDAPGLRQQRLYLSVFGGWVVRQVTRTRLADPFSGYFVTRRDLFEAARPRLTGEGFKILLDLVLACETPPRLAELPARLSHRAAGQSKFGLDTVWALLRMLAVHRMRGAP